jgi:hypothetical protein
MKHFLAVCVTALLFTTVGLAQNTSNPQTSSDPYAVPIDQTENVNRHDYGWIGLIGLLGLSGLFRRRDPVARDTKVESRDVDTGRAA